MRFLERHHAERLSRLLRTFPAVLMVGPRQCGKSTLARHALAQWTFLDLERPSNLTLMAADLEGFLQANSRALVIAEAQRLPDLFPALRHRIDAVRGKGRFLLLGSASPALMRSASESLAGRVGLLELTPFLPSELSGSARSNYSERVLTPGQARRRNVDLDLHGRRHQYAHKRRDGGPCPGEVFAEERCLASEGGLIRQVEAHARKGESTVSARTGRSRQRSPNGLGLR